MTTRDRIGTRLRRHEHIAREGERQDHVHQIEEGWACSYRMLADGRRQITGLYLPGEFCEPQWVLSGKATQPVVALTDMKLKPLPIAAIRKKDYAANLSDDPGMQAVTTAILAKLDRQADWIVSLGRKTGLERVSGLACELVERLRLRTRIIDGRCAVPLTQTDIADLVGMTPIHVNRILRTLRERGLMDWRDKWLCVPDPEKLQRAASGWPVKDGRRFPDQQATPAVPAAGPGARSLH